MIIADENIDHSLIEAIRTLGLEVYSIYELQRGVSDESIIELSHNPPRLILTEDKDFGEWVFAHQVRDISVLFLRYHFRDTELMKQRLLKLLSERLPDLSSQGRAHPQTSDRISRLEIGLFPARFGGNRPISRTD